MANKCPYGQSYGFSSIQVQMWEFNHREGWVLKNWWVWTVVLEKTLESPLDSKEIKLVNPKGNQPWIFIGRTVVEAELPILWPPEESWLFGKDPDAGKDWKQEEKGTTEDKIDSINNSMDTNLSELWEIAEDRGVCHATVHEVTKSWTQVRD